ncbi:MAG: hypothetical protein R3C53_10745 [Pirellulaceae bacterium]
MCTRSKYQTRLLALFSACAMLLGRWDYAEECPTEFAGSSALAQGALDVQWSVRQPDSGVEIAARPGKWTQIVHGPLVIDASFPGMTRESDLDILLDGKPVHPELLTLNARWTDEQGWHMSMQWPCPPLGRHSLQLTATSHSHHRPCISESLLIEILAPQRPEIVAAGGQYLSPISGQVLSVYQDSVTVKFAMADSSGVLLVCDGIEPQIGTSVGNCCYQFDLRSQFAVGRHALRFQRQTSGTCAMTSELSDPLWIQYEPPAGQVTLRNENARRRKSILSEIERLATGKYSTPVTAEIEQHLGDPKLYFKRPVQPPNYGPLPGALRSMHQLFQSMSTGVESGIQSSVKSILEAATTEPERPESQGTETSSPESIPETTNTEPQDIAPTPTTPAQPPENRPQAPAEPVPDAEDGTWLLRNQQSHLVNLNQTGQADSILEPSPASETLPTPAPTNLLSPPTQPESVASVVEDPRAAIDKRLNSWNLQRHSANTLAGLSQLRAEQLAQLELDMADSEASFRTDHVVSSVVFDAPAIFTRKGYGRASQEDAKLGLLLLEGMQLQTAANGHWQLTIPFVPPQSPSELRLQIQFLTADGRWKSLTVQPICFDPMETCGSDQADCGCDSCSRENFRTITGYSAILEREAGFFTEVRRRGSVTFGHGFAGLEDRRSF